MSSSDDGHTYVAYPGVQIPFGVDTGRRWIWSEPTIIELSDGRIGMLLRMSNTGCLWYAESLDKGKTWTEATPPRFPTPPINLN